MWVGSGVGIHRPPRHFNAVQLKLNGRLERQYSTSAQGLNTNRHACAVYASGDEEGLPEEIIPPHRNNAVEVAQTIASQVQDGVKLSNQERWDKNLHDLEKYVQQHGRVPSRNVPVLGPWVHYQRIVYTKYLRNEGSPMTSSRISALEAVPGWEWVPLEHAWNAKLQELKKWVQQHGQLPLASHPTLGRWVSKQRCEYTIRLEGKTASMNDERIKALEAIPGWVWSPYEAAFTAKLEELKTWEREYGSIPLQTHLTLGQWVNDQRREYSKFMAGKVSSMNAQRIAALEAVPGWIWGVDHESEWFSKLIKLKEFVERYGKLPVQRHPVLGPWVSRQRTEYRNFKRGKHSPMTLERIAALEGTPEWAWRA